MTGLDTNVLVRYITRDDEAQTRAADRLIESATDAADPLFINHVVLCELVWVLARSYGVPKTGLVEALDAIMNTPGLQIEEGELSFAALEDYRRSGADFADCLIGMKNRSLGCGATLTFDGQAGKLRTFQAI